MRNRRGEVVDHVQSRWITRLHVEACLGFEVEEALRGGSRSKSLGPWTGRWKPRTTGAHISDLIESAAMVELLLSRSPAILAQ